MRTARMMLVAISVVLALGEPVYAQQIGPPNVVLGTVVTPPLRSLSVEQGAQDTWDCFVVNVSTQALSVNVVFMNGITGDIVNTVSQSLPPGTGADIPFTAFESPPVVYCRVDVVGPINSQLDSTAVRVALEVNGLWVVQGE